LGCLLSSPTHHHFFFPRIGKELQVVRAGEAELHRVDYLSGADAGSGRSVCDARVTQFYKRSYGLSISSVQSAKQDTI
jgi:hypothetical protein